MINKEHPIKRADIEPGYVVVQIRLTVFSLDLHEGCFAGDWEFQRDINRLLRFPRNRVAPVAELSEDQLNQKFKVTLMKLFD